MNKSIKEQLEFLWCEDKNIHEPILKPTDFEFNGSNDISPTSDKVRRNEGLKRE